MRKHNLQKNGLSMSQAQSISNLCNQTATSLYEELINTNNSKRTTSIDGKEFVIQDANPLPDDALGILTKIGKYRACQAFLMENIKAKNVLMAEAESDMFFYAEPEPVQPVVLTPDILSPKNIEWGWEQLSVSELNEFYEAEAMAAHIGKFIHKNGYLTKLRQGLKQRNTVDWVTVEEGKKTPVSIVYHHSVNGLLEIHNKMAKEHRKYEQKVNYFKAKVNNLVSEENHKIALLNAKERERCQRINTPLLEEYSLKYEKYKDDKSIAKSNFVAEKTKKVQKLSKLKINIPERFQGVIDEFLLDK